MKLNLKILILLFFLFISVLTVVVGRHSVNKPSELVFQEYVESGVEKDKDVEETSENRCKYPFYVQQATTAAEWSKDVAEEILGFLDSYPDLNDQERKLFEEGKIIANDCYEALYEWNDSNTLKDEEDYRYDCHQKILKTLEINKETLGYMSREPDSFDKSLVEKNMSEIIDFSSEYFEIEDNWATGIMKDRDIKCPEILFLEY